MIPLNDYPIRKRPLNAAERAATARVAARVAVLLAAPAPRPDLLQVEFQADNNDARRNDDWGAL